MFNLGMVTMTAGIDNAMCKSILFFNEVSSALKRYIKGDWGDLCKEDKQANEDALKYGERIFAKYNTSLGPIYIITEWDRSVTTILFADEY